MIQTKEQFRAEFLKLVRLPLYPIFEMEFALFAHFGIFRDRAESGGNDSFT